MGLDIFFGDDLQNRLDGMADVAQHLPESEFKRGFFACLNSIRWSLGLLPTLTIPSSYRKASMVTDHGPPGAGFVTKNGV